MTVLVGKRSDVACRPSAAQFHYREFRKQTNLLDTLVAELGCTKSQETTVVSSLVGARGSGGRGEKQRQKLGLLRYYVWNSFRIDLLKRLTQWALAERAAAPGDDLVPRGGAATGVASAHPKCEAFE
jgi:hypothetical protein